MAPTPLEQILREQIDHLGPIRLDRFMDLCLTHPEHGYYSQASAIGGDSNQGDFITAPEVSQMFGEMIAVWIMSTWQALDQPDQLQLVELGPGRGTMMSDIMSVLKNQSALMSGLKLFVMDASETRWRDKLSSYHVTPLTDLQELDTSAPMIVIGNEFFDALPVRQFVRIGEGQDAQWGETHVYASDEGLGLCQTITALPAMLADEQALELEVLEHCAAAGFIVDTLAAKLREARGAALFLDYGYHHSPGQSTLQAVRGHEKVDPLSQPGETDLTTLVNFGMLKDAARAAGCQVSDITNQGDFLRALGIDQRSVDLAKANPDRAKEIGGQLHRLTADEEMGVLFKALSFWHI